jgi:hypothetical protein
MHILAESRKFFQTNILSAIKRKHNILFSFGFSALTLNQFSSLNSNARMTIEKRCTAETKIYRLVSNKKILTYFPILLTNLSLLKPGDRINVDFSTFCGFQVLTFAKQTSLGRAIPVYIAAITYPIENPGSQTQFIIAEVKKFIKLLGFSVHLVFDRGFELPYLANSLIENHINFTIRMRKDKHILYQGKDIPLRNLPWFENDVFIGIYGKELRMVRSEKKKGMDEPWYLLTNDITSIKDKVIADYYFRFEIEETFKDLKHIFDLKSFYKIKKKQTFLILLWFYILGNWIMWLLTPIKNYLQTRLKENKHKRLSVTKFFFEQICLTRNLPFCFSP